ncbi:MAG: hypothetical protein AAFP16_02840 [Pseudomonadota bacterium]
MPERDSMCGTEHSGSLHAQSCQDDRPRADVALAVQAGLTQIRARRERLPPGVCIPPDHGFFLQHGATARSDPGR